MTSLRSLTILFLLAFGSATALTGYLVYTTSRTASEVLVDQRVRTVADALLSEVDPGDAASILKRIDDLSRQRDTGDIGFELAAADGRRLGGNVRLLRALPLGLSSLHVKDSIAGLTAGRAEVRDVGGGLRLTTIAETEPIDGYAAVRQWTYLLGFGAIVVIVVGGLALFILIVRRRIGEVRGTAEAIIDGDLARRVPVDGSGLFAEQARAFNRMLDRIGMLMEDIRNVSGDVAHDLRTPLARLRSRLAVMEPHATTPQQREELDAAIQQCDEMMMIFAAILRIAEIDGGDRRGDFRRIELDELVQELADTMCDAAEESGHRLLVRPMPASPIEGDRQLLSQAILNLIENALHHTPAGSTVTIALTLHGRARGSEACLSIADDGPGIPAADRATALRRFGRLDASRHRPGHGLGLPLVAAVARLHGGELLLRDHAPGLDAALMLPLRASV